MKLIWQGGKPPREEMLIHIGFIKMDRFTKGRFVNLSILI
jgi:hypothetical protein